MQVGVFGNCSIEVQLSHSFFTTIIEACQVRRILADLRFVLWGWGEFFKQAVTIIAYNSRMTLHYGPWITLVSITVLLQNAAKICFKLRRCKYIQGSGVEWYSGTQHYLYQFWLLSTSLWLLQGHSTQKQLAPPVTETLLMKQRFSKQTIFKSLIIAI